MADARRRYSDFHGNYFSHKMKQIKKNGKIAQLRERFLFFLYPPKCANCGTIGYTGLCPKCAEKLDEAFKPRKFLANGGNGFADAMFALFPYDDSTVKKLLLSWKHEDFFDLPFIFNPYIKRFYQKNLLPEKIDCIAYLPRRTAARKKFGFDQAERIEKLFSSQFRLPTRALLLRQGRAKAQSKSKFEDREKNIHGAFRANCELAGETVLLIDDIVTTGATAREGARILKKAGAMKVYILSLAH